MEAFTFDTTEQILLAATGTLFIIQALYYLCLYNRIHLRSRAVKRGNVHFSQELPPVSVIICAREECENLRRNLKAVLEQDYPQFEVIVINDGNTDESEDYLTLLEEKYPHLYHSFVPDSSRYISRKKLAATLGVKASKYDWLVFTEANCCPQSNQWLRLLARNLSWDIAAMNAVKAGCTSVWLSTICSLPCATSALRLPEARIWASGVTLPTARSCFTNTKGSLHISTFSAAMTTCSSIM